MATIKDHPILIVLSLILGAFLAGAGAYIWLDGEIGRRLDARDSSSGLMKLLPVGAIVAYHSKDGSIPSGWALCNGDYGAPDLRDQ